MEGSKTVLLVGTLDTKGAEYAYLRDRLRLHGIDTILADAGVNEPVGVEPDLHVGGDPGALAAAGDRGAAVTAMADAAEELARRLFAEGRIGGVLAAGGSGGTAIATRAMQALPVGAPKLMVSTMAAGNTADYVGASDVTMMASVTDVAGVNSISGRILANAAAAMAGMMQAPPVELGEQKPLIGASMFGVTTPCVTHARERLEGLGYEVLTFHATGAGGRAMEGLMESGFLHGRARHHDHRAVRRAGRRRAVGGPGPARGRGSARASPRWCPSAHSTWSTSAPARRSRRSSRIATCTCTTPRSR